MASIFNIHADGRTLAAWRACLAAAFRTTAACAIVACATLYGPASFRGLVGFPAFSYVTVILIITDASLGDALCSCWLALYATAQSLGPAMLSLWLIDPSRLTRTFTSLAVALGAFVVALPESTHLVSKRIALGQIVIVYVMGFINNGEKTEPVMHTARVAVSTGVGVLACVLALLLPFPRLACQEVYIYYTLMSTLTYTVHTHIHIIYICLYVFIRTRYFFLRTIYSIIEIFLNLTNYMYEQFFEYIYVKLTTS